MPGRIFKPQMCSDKTTSGRITKFGIITPEDIPSGAIEAFFQFPPQT